MANFYKTLNQTNDIVSTRTLLHEAIPLTGTIISGTYSDLNIKNYTHGMFQSVYDYPFLSSSANHIFDITIGVSAQSSLSSSLTSQGSKKINLYNQMAQVLMGYDSSNNINLFDEDGDLIAGGSKQKEVFFFNFSRLLIKDEIKKGSFSTSISVAQSNDPSSANFMANCIDITDFSGSNGYLVNSPVGEYGILYATASSTAIYQLLHTDQYFPVGLIFYQAGVAVISGSIFMDQADGGILNNSPGTANLKRFEAAVGNSGFNSVTGSTISASANDIRARIKNIQFNNTVELNSTVYFCRAHHNEFNYSSNPTYLSGSEIRVKTNATDTPISYITTVGLYSDNNELMAVGKLSEPLKKSPDNEFTIRVRLDYWFK